MNDAPLLYEERLGGEMRYTEKRGDADVGRETRFCELWLDGVEEHVAYSTLVSIRQRFGAVVIPAEGFAGVATVPQYRRQGLMNHLFTKGMQRAAERVDALFLYGIHGFYPRFGFVTCGAECKIRLSVREGRQARHAAGETIRQMTRDDFPAMCGLYNREHAQRSWSHERDPKIYPGPAAARDWNPGQQGWVLERDNTLRGYYIRTLGSLGAPRPISVAEFCAATSADAESLVAHVVAAALERPQEQVTFLEPPDSTAGRLLRRLGCEVVLVFPADCDGMGKITNRPSLIAALRPELTRRAATTSDNAISALAEGRLYPDDSILLPLLTGFHSWRDAAETGHPPPPEYEDEVRQWFGGCDGRLPVPFTHRHDRY